MSQKAFKIIPNPKDQVLALDKSLYEMSWNVPKNHITAYAKNRIDYPKYAKNAHKALSNVDDRFLSLSDEFLEHVLLPALAASMSEVNLSNKSKIDALFPSFSHVLKGIHHFYSHWGEKRLNSPEHSLINEAIFFKRMIQTGSF